MVVVVVVVVVDATRTALRFFFNCNGIARKLELTVLSNLLWDPPLLLVVLVLRIVRSDPKRRGMSTVVFVVVGLFRKKRPEKEKQLPPVFFCFKNYHQQVQKKASALRELATYGSLEDVCKEFMYVCMYVHVVYNNRALVSHHYLAPPFNATQIRIRWPSFVTPISFKTLSRFWRPW